jgi:hypothetical protein
MWRSISVKIDFWFVHDEFSSDTAGELSIKKKIGQDRVAKGKYFINATVYDYWPCKGMYYGREGIPSLSLPHHLEKALNMTCTMHYLLLSSLTINKK